MVIYNGGINWLSLSFSLIIEAEKTLGGNARI